MPRTTINSSGARGRAASNLSSKPARKTKGKANGKSSNVKARASDEDATPDSNDEVTNNNDNDAISAPSGQRKRKASESLSDPSPSSKVAKTDHGSAGDESPGFESVASGQQGSEGEIPDHNSSQQDGEEQNDSKHDDEEDVNEGGGDEVDEQDDDDEAENEDEANDQDNEGSDAASTTSYVTHRSVDSPDYYEPNPLALSAHRILVILNPYVPETPTTELMQKVRDARNLTQTFTDPHSAAPATERLMTLVTTILLLEQLFEVEARGADNRVYVSDEAVATMRQIDADVAALDRM